MSTQTPDGVYSFPAGADLSGSQYCGVVINTSGEAVLPAAGVLPDGFLQNIPLQGEQARVQILGKVLKAKAGTGGVTVGAKVSCSATGTFITNGATNAAFAGKALDAVAVNGIFRLLAIPDMGLHA